MSRPFRISYFAGEKDNAPASIDLTWEQLTSQLQSPTIAACTLATCAGSKCPHKLGPAWSPAVYPKGASRAKRHVSAVSVLVLDLDHMTDVQVAEVALKLAPYRYIAHATHSDRAGDRCLRVALELDAPVPGADWPRFWSTAVAALGVPADPSTCDASRLYFLPSRPSDADYLEATNEGGPISVAAVMAIAPAPSEPTEHVPLPGAAAVASPELMHEVALELASAWPPARTQFGGGGRHYAFLALAGALAMGGWPEDAITDLTTRVARLMPNSDEKAINDRPLQAASSIANIARGVAVTSWGELASRLTKPDVISSVRAKLNMKDASDGVFDGLFGTPAPSLSEGYPAATALSALDTFAANRAQLASAVPGVTAEPGTFLHYVQQAQADVATALGTSGVVGANETPMFEPAKELFRRQFPATPWIVQGLVTEGGIAAVVGEPKSAKSWLALELAMSVASGTDAVGGRFRVPVARPTAYFFAEDMAQSVRNRLRAFAAGRGRDPESLTQNLYVQPRGRHLDLTKTEDVSRIIASCRAIGSIGLLVLDPLRDIHSGSENESDDMSAVFSNLRVLGTVLGCTIVIVHHAKKPSKEESPDGAEIRGSSAIWGALDGLISMKNPDGDRVSTFTAKVKAKVKNARSAGEFPCTLKVQDDQNGEAIHAVWSTDVGASLEASGKADDVMVQELMIRCLEHLVKSELQKAKAQSNQDIRNAVKANRDHVAAAMIEAERLALVLPYMKGNMRYGWQITDAGRVLVHDRNEPIS